MLSSISTMADSKISAIRDMARRNHSSNADRYKRKSRSDTGDRRRKRNAKDEGGSGRKRVRPSRSRSGSGRSDNYKEVRVLKDDEEGHLICNVGDVIVPSDGSYGSYKITRKLGEGTFGKVVAVQGKHGPQMALKIIRSTSRYRSAARVEIRILEDLRKADPDSKSLVIRLKTSFNYYGHPCLLFPLLGQSVFDFLKGNKYVPFQTEHVRSIGRQLTQAVGFLHRNRLTHTDLKPENLMFVHDDYEYSRGSDDKRYRVLKNPDVVLIDLGGATYEDEHHTTVVSTRHYRAPEVILQIGWSYPCDVWSIGCILYELARGNTLFQTHQSREHLAIMEKTLGPIPSSMIMRAKTTHFKSNGKLDYDMTAAEAQYVREKCFPLRHDVKPGGEEDKLFSLIELMLTFEPAKRITCDDALKHEFFAPGSSASSRNGVS